MPPAFAAQPDCVTVIGAGLAGTLMSVLLAQRGHKVRLYEHLPDMRRETVPAGRSINMALAARGIRALEMAGVMQQVMPLLIPMPGRLLHDVNGELTFVPYGQGEHEVIYSVSRPGLNLVLLEAAQAAGVDIHFRHSAVEGNFEQQRIVMRDETSGALYELPMHRVIAADGAGSLLRRSLAAETGANCVEALLEHGYKELTLAPGPHGEHRIHRNALHIWPRGGFMLIALPNLDGSFTVTLFLSQTGAGSFATLTDPASINAFFSRHFADAHELMPDLATEFLAHPIGVMGTVRCDQWSFGEHLLLIGDAAHAITPFHGQGMNCTFEDCAELNELLVNPDWGSAFAAFARSRRPNTDAIADMAIENYVEMRDTVRHPKFQLQKILSLQLERRFPDRFVPRYSMVMFHDEIPYAVAYERGRIQNAILEQLTRHASSLDEIDEEAAAALIERQLPPI